jgi:DNA primase
MLDKRFHAGRTRACGALANEWPAHDISPMTLPKGFLEELRDRTSLVRLVGRKVTWDNRKSNTARGDYWAPCPFHQERTPSFHVEEAKGRYYCFGCHASGDAINFLCETENMGFMEAVESLARDAGMTIPAGAKAAKPGENDRRARLFAAMEAAAAFYRLQLATSRGAEARAYLDQRRLRPETRERFGIGYAPTGWTALAEHLASKGFREDELLEAGLLKQPDGGGRCFDRFRGRVIFPIRDASGRTVALGGRLIEAREGAPKYLNSPETPLYDKGRTLFNFREARAAAGRNGPLLVAEGYMDVIALVQAGFEAAVAPLGTSITEDQLELLWRVAPEPVVTLDGDAAGLGAAHRLIDLALPRLVAGRSLRFVLLPADQDPDDLIRSGGREAMAAAIEGSLPIVELLWRRETAGQPLDSPDRRAALDARLKAHLARIRDESLRAHTWAAIRERRARLFADRTPKPPRDGRAFARGPAPWSSGPYSAGRGAAPGARFRGLPLPASAAAKGSLLASASDGTAAEARVRESAILIGLLNHPALLARFEERLERIAFVCPDLAEVRDALLSCIGDSLPVSVGTGSDSVTSTVAPCAETEKATEAETVAARVGTLLGRDPRSRLAASGHVHVNPHIAAGADPERAAAAIEEEIIRHAAWIDKALEVREAMSALESGGAEALDEGLTWRLREAAEAEHRAARAGLPDEATSGADAVSLSRGLQDMIDRQVWKRNRGTR